MRKHRLLFSLMLMASVAVFYSCKENEVAKPIENTARIDALKTELRALQLQVLGTTKTLNETKANEASLKTQIAALKNQYNKRVTYTLKAINTRGKNLEGVVFSLAQAGMKVSKTSDASGAVVFEDMRGGVVTGTVKKDGYTVANFNATLYKSNNDEDEEDINNAYSITSTIPLLPAPGSTMDEEMFTIEGYLYANFNLADDTLDGSGASLGTSDPAFTYPGLNTHDENVSYSLVKDKKVKAIFTGFQIPKTNIGGSDDNLFSLSYDDAVYMATVDANTGKWTLKLPSISIYNESFPMELKFEEFEADQDIVQPGFSKSYEAAQMPPTFKRKKRFFVDTEDELYYGHEFGVTDENGIILGEIEPGQVLTTKYFYSESDLIYID